MSKQEQRAQLSALTREIEGNELAIERNEDKIATARERGDETEANRLERDNEKYRRTIRVAQEQTQILSGSARTRAGRSQTRA